MRQEKETETSQSQKNKKKEGTKETMRQGKAGEQSEKCMRKETGNGPAARHSADATAQLHGDLGKCVILTSRGPVTSFLPITLYEVFITALSGAVD